jgi:ABC-type Mn2+/Zn2+ transport system permease subunit
VLFAAVGALLLGLLPEGKNTTREWSLGAVYLVSSALILLVGGFIPQELHDVNDILFGNAIAIERNQMIFTVVVSLLLLGIHLLLAHVFMAVAFDPVTLAAHGAPVRWLDALLFLTMGLATAFSTRVVGALPAFAFSVFPSAAALLIVHNIRLMIVIAALLGAISAFLGYYASFLLSLPTGACMAASSLLIYALVRILNRALGRFHRLPSKRS